MGREQRSVQLWPFDGKVASGEPRAAFVDGKAFLRLVGALVDARLTGNLFFAPVVRHGPSACILHTFWTVVKVASRAVPLWHQAMDAFAKATLQLRGQILCVFVVSIADFWKRLGAGARCNHFYALDVRSHPSSHPKDCTAALWIVRLPKLLLRCFVVCSVALIVPEQFPLQLHWVEVDAACYVKVGAPVAIDFVALPLDTGAFEPLPVLFHKGTICAYAEGPVAVRDGLSHFLDHPALVIVAAVGRVDHELGYVLLEGVDSSKGARVLDDVEVAVGDQLQVPRAYVGVGKALTIALLAAFVKEVALLRLPHGYGGTGLFRVFPKRQARRVHEVDRLPLSVLQRIVWRKGRQGTAAARLPLCCRAAGRGSLAVGKVANVTLLRGVKL